MYAISVEEHIDAAHFLRGYKGKCEAMHGHRFRIVAKVKATKLDNIGLAYDFAELKKHLRDVIARLDHVCLNDIPPFDKINPSSENLAATLYGELKGKLAGAPVTLLNIEVWESPTTGIVYTPD